MVMDAGRGYRLVVPSPVPLAIPEKGAILSLMAAGSWSSAGAEAGSP